MIKLKEEVKMGKAAMHACEMHTDRRLNGIMMDRYGEPHASRIEAIEEMTRWVAEEYERHFAEDPTIEVVFIHDHDVALIKGEYTQVRFSLFRCNAEGVKDRVGAIADTVPLMTAPDAEEMIEWEENFTVYRKGGTRTVVPFDEDL